jgi:CubicO group peptidase (beta-lactamase class C family)
MFPDQIEHTRDLCASWVASGHTPSLGVCAARRGVVVLHEAFGSLNPDGDPLQLDSIFAVSSVTKSVTAALTMQLVEDGLLGLNRPARDYLPEITGGDGDDILVHNLLTHTSGYAWHTDPVMLLHAAEKMKAGVAAPPCPDNLDPEVHQLLNLLWDVPRVHAVNEFMTYSNHNYALLGELLRRITGKSIDDLARERLFEPLEMKDSFFSLPDSETHRYVMRPPDAALAEPDPMGLFDGINSESWRKHSNAGSGLCSSPRDMLTFGQMILNGGSYGSERVLSPAGVAAMTRDQVPGIRANMFGRAMNQASWGYGFAVESPSKWRFFRGSLISLGSVTHPGAGGATFWIDAERELVGAYFEVCMRLTADWEFLWNYDLFENAITAAVDY